MKRTVILGRVDMKNKVRKVATEEMAENEVNLEDIAKYLSVSNDTICN